METLKATLEEALASKFRGAQINLSSFRRGKPVGGTLVWKGFEGKAQIDRQVELRRVIRAALPENEQSKISFILTVTPDELESITVDD